MRTIAERPVIVRVTAAAMLAAASACAAGARLVTDVHIDGHDLVVEKCTLNGYCDTKRMPLPAVAPKATACQRVDVNHSDRAVNDAQQHAERPAIAAALAPHSAGSIAVDGPCGRHSVGRVVLGAK
jgi:hypothetical protein